MFLSFLNKDRTFASEHYNRWMMLPVALSVAGEPHGEEERRFALCLLLGVAYGCSIGGIATHSQPATVRSRSKVPSGQPQLPPMQMPPPG